MIKRHPEDFRVEEVPSRELVPEGLSEAGRFALYRLTKRGVATDEAIERVAAKLSLPPGRIGYGGLKDKHALTVQYVTIQFPPRRPAPALVEGAAWKLELLGRVDRGISAGDVSGNRFRVTIRGLTRRECDRITAARRFLSNSASGGGKRLLFVNYYGEQRFGSARHGRGFAARRLIEGDFEGALELLIATPDRKDTRARKDIKRIVAALWGAWKALSRALPASPERSVALRLARTGGDFRAGFSALPHFIQQMTLEAYQSWLWNAIARRVVAEECGPPFVEAPSRFGSLIFPHAAGIPSGLAAAVIPLFSRETALREPWSAAAGSVLEEEGIALRDLRVPGLRTPFFGEVDRALFVEALEFSLGPLEADESVGEAGRFKRRARFLLPRGAYGTVLLSALGGASHSSLR
jgi:tRNA pseudouridine13 synthase